MHEKIYDIFQNQIRKIRENYIDRMFTESIPLEAEIAVTDHPVKYKDRLSLKYMPVYEGACWGRAWDSAWLHLQAKIPASFKGKELCLRINTGSESLLFDKKGVPLYGLTGFSVFDLGYNKDFYVLENFKGSKVDFWLEASANGLFGINQPDSEDVDPKYPAGYYTPVIKHLKLCTFDREMWHFCLEFKCLYQQLQYFGPDTYQGKQLLHSLTKAVNVLGYDAKNAAAARKIIRDEILCHKADSGALTANLIGHAHIDVGWLWPVSESTRKAARTFSSQLVLMDKYPEYKFGASQAYLYKTVKENYPELFEKIRKRVKEGRWEVQGGMFVEADANLISGESMVRQFLYAKNFFMDEFGVNVRNLWIPDVFGYSASMPQIMKKAGCDYFLTQKISWSEINQFPYNTFRWIGIDGSEVITHFPPEDTYNADASPDSLARGQNKFCEAGCLPGFMSLIGIGDGGGGPSENYVERARIAKDLRGCPKAQFRFAQDFFDELQRYRDQLPVWNGELYLEKHRGTLTTQARVKRGNRKCEQALTALEILASCLPAGEYPKEKIDQAWEKVLLNQFHDIIPGSSIGKVYERTWREHEEVLTMAEAESERLCRKLFRKKTDCAVAVNTLSSPWVGCIELPERWNGYQVLAEDAEDGKPEELNAQVHNGKTVVSVYIPANGFLTLRRGKKTKKKEVRTRTRVLENDYIRYEFNAQGRLTKAFNKVLNLEFLAGDGNVLTLYKDHPNNYDAWDIDITYPGNAYPNGLKCTAAGYAVKGDAQTSIEFTYRTERSEIRQTVVLCADSTRLDFITHADWHENHIMLRTAFPVNVRSEKASFDIQYGFVERPTSNNTSWEQAKFETCGQRYADLSNREFGAALLNDCKYGYRVKGNTLDLNLLRSPKHPDYFADMGEHDFTYSFLPHPGEMPESWVMESAASLNRAPVVMDGYEAGNAVMPVRIESESVSLEVVKRAQHDDSRIIRLVETRGLHGEADVLLTDRKAKVTETDLMEWKKGPAMKLQDGVLHVSLKPFEIMTLRVESGK